MAVRWDRILGRDTSSPDLVRRAWGVGIASVMIIAVSPYPLMGLFSADEIPHRIHNTVGALQYLPLWAVPVLIFSVGTDRAAAWRIALASSTAIAATGVWSGDLIPSLSWMPLATLLVLWPGRLSWRPQRLWFPAIAATALVTWVAMAEAPHLVNLQRLHMGDSHSLRFHFSGMAAAYIALALCCGIIALFEVGRGQQVIVAGSTIAAGVCSIAWPGYESALSGDRAATLVVAGVALLISSGASARRFITRAWQSTDRSTGVSQ